MGIVYSKNRLLSTVTSVDCKSGFNSLAVNSLRFVVFVVLVVGMIAMDGVVKAESIFTITEKTFSDNFPLLREKDSMNTSLQKICTNANDKICLPNNCEIDYDKGSKKGYDSIVHDFWPDDKITHSVTFDENTKCLSSSVSLCTIPTKSGYKFYGEHVIYGKCKENAGTITVTPENPAPLCNNSSEVTLNANLITATNCQWHRNEVEMPDEINSTLKVLKGGKYQLLCDNAFSEIISIPQCMQGTVWHDINGNGERDADATDKLEPLLKDVWISSGNKIEKYEKVPDSMSNVILTDDSENFELLTDLNGKYSFPSLEGGTYQLFIGDKNDSPFYGVEVSKPLESDSGYYGSYYLINPPVYEDFDFGIKLPASISGTVYNDKNCNNKQDSGELGIDGLTVRSDSYLDDTDVNGEYTTYVYFDGTKKTYITPSSLASLEEGWIPTSPVNGEYNVPIKDKYDTVTGIDFGYKQLLLDIHDTNVLSFPHLLPTSDNLVLKGEKKGTFTWHKGDLNGPIITKAPDAGTYWVEYSEPSSMCKTSASMQLLEKDAQTSWDGQGYYCIYGDADNKPYSWKLEGVKSGIKTLIASNLEATPVSSGGLSIQLSEAFIDSLDSYNSSPLQDGSLGNMPPKGGKIINSIEVYQTTTFPNCFSIQDKISLPYDSLNLYVGNALVEPTCLVENGSPCVYNPEIIKIVSDGQCILPPQGTVAWYSFDENSTEGKAGKAITFDGSNSIEMPNSTTLNFGEGNFSISTWIKTTNDYGYILNKMYKDNNTGNRQGYALYLSNGKLGVQLADGNGFGGCSIDSSAPCTDYISDADILINDGEWHLIAVTIDRNNAQGGKFYIDGLEVGVFNPTFRIGSLNNDEPLILGNTFTGELDELSLAQAILPANDIAGFYQADSAGLCEIPESLSSPTNNLSVTPSSQSISATSGSFTIDIANTGNGTMEWIATSDSWLTISNTSGTNDGTITVNYSANTGDARTGIIIVTSEGAENSPQTVEVKQDNNIIIAVLYTAFGKILDNLGNPIAGATIKVGDKTTTTDASGSWTILDLPTGSYTVTAEKDGYQFKSQNVTLTGDNLNTEVNIELTPSDCEHAKYLVEERLVKIHQLDIPLLNPITQEPTGEFALATVDLSLIDGADDFKMISDTLTIIEVPVEPSECNANYDYDGILHIPYIDMEDFIILNGVVIGSVTKTYDVTMQQLPLSPDVFHLEEYILK